MGASQSTRNLPDYVYVHLHVVEDQVKLNLFVCHTENRYQLRQWIQEKEQFDYNQDVLPSSIDPREQKDVYLHIHTDDLETPKISVRATKTLEQIIEERNQAFSTFS